MSEEKVDASTKDGRYSFRPCHCGAAAVHGYFHEPNGDKLSSSSLRSTKDAKEALTFLVDMGIIPASDQAAVETDIEEAGLPEVFDIETAAKQALAYMLKGLEREPHEKDGRFSFRTAVLNDLNHGNFYDPSGSRIQGHVTSKSTALNVMRDAVNDGIFPEEDAGMIEDDIRTSDLPEDETYLGPFALKIHRGRGYFSAVKYEMSLPVDGMSTRKVARHLLEWSLKDGVILEEEREGLLNAINESELPEEEIDIPSIMEVGITILRI